MGMNRKQRRALRNWLSGLADVVKFLSAVILLLARLFHWFN